MEIRLRESIAAREASIAQLEVSTAQPSCTLPVCAMLQVLTWLAQTARDRAVFLERELSESHAASKRKNGSAWRLRQENQVGTARCSAARCCLGTGDRVRGSISWRRTVSMCATIRLLSSEVAVLVTQGGAGREDCEFGGRI